MRGYDPDAVETALQEVNRDLILTKNRLSKLQQELHETKRALALAETDLEQRGAPSYAGLGAKFEHVLRDAEQTAEHLITEAEIQADAIVEQAEEEAQSIRKLAEEQYQQKISDLEHEASRNLEIAQVKARQLLEAAELQREEMAAEALREATAIRGAVATESAEIRSNAKREAEHLKSLAALEAAEIKTLALKEVTDGFDPEMVLSQQVRQDLEVELAARRFKAEQEFLAKHQEAVNSTQKYLDEANALLAKTIGQLNEKRLEADTVEAAALSDAKKIRELARIEADERIAQAEQEALKAVNRAKKTARKETEELRKELTSLLEQEKALRQYFSGMKSLINQAAHRPMSPAPDKKSNDKPPLEA